MEPERILITGGMIYDGTGNAPFRGDLLLKGKRIEAVLPYEQGRGKALFMGQDADAAGRHTQGNLRIIHAEGCAVTPGFVDVHRHCDLAALADPDFGRLELKQGITTVLGGNCGMSLAPSADGSREAMLRFLEPCLGKAPAGQEMKFPDFRSYLEALRAKKTKLNMEAMVGTGAVRIAVKGFDRSALTPAERETARGLLAEALDQGAQAASAGIMYVPECFNTARDWYAFGREIAERNKLLTIHIRGEGDGLLPSVREVIDIAQRTGARINISHFKSVGMANWKRDIYKAVELIDQSGQDITADVYPYDGGSTMLGTLLPPALSARYGDGLCRALGTEEGVRSACEALERSWEGWDDMLRAIGGRRILISSLEQPGNRWMIGKTLDEVVKEGGFHSPARAIAALMHEEEGKVGIIVRSMCPEDVEYVAALPFTSFISDALYGGGRHPHPRLYGAFPKVIEEFVCRKKLLTLQEAIHKMSGKPAERFGLENRGLLREGYFADVLVFKPDEIRSPATYIEPCAEALGMRFVFVEGQAVMI